MSRKLRIGFLVGAVVVMLISAWQLWSLLLWEYWSLIFLGSLWLSLLLLKSLGKKSTASSRKQVLLSSLSGVLLAISFPPFPLTFLIFLAFIPLFYLWKEFQQDGGKNPLKRIWWHSYNAFIIWNIISTFWVCNSALLPGIFAIGVNALLMTLPFLLSAWSSRKVGKYFRWLVWVAPWVAFEYGHLHWELSWPWLTLGNAFATFPKVVQWYEFTGVLGGSVWILTLNYFIAKYRFPTRIKEPVFSGYPLLLSLLLLPILLSLVQYAGFEEKPRTVNFSIIQPNYEPHYEKFVIPSSIQARQVIQLMTEAVTDSTEYVLLPETVFENIDLGEFEHEEIVQHLTKWLEENKGITLLMGLSSHRFVGEDEVNKYTRTFERNGETYYYRSQNSAVAYDGEHKEEYFKSRFVPGAEIFPYSKYLFFFKPLVDQLGGSIVGFEPQEKPTTFTLGSSEIAPLICYESIYPEYSTGFMDAGAKVIAIMTNDGWWGDTFGYRQHNAFARLMAIEMRRDIVRSANTGISSVINARGDVLQATKYGERTFLNASVSERVELTFYARYKDLTGKAAAILVIPIFLIGLIRRKNN